MNCFEANSETYLFQITSEQNPNFYIHLKDGNIFCHKSRTSFGGKIVASKNECTIYEQDKVSILCDSNKLYAFHGKNKKLIMGGNYLANLCFLSDIFKNNLNSIIAFLEQNYPTKYYNYDDGLRKINWNNLHINETDIVYGSLNLETIMKLSELLNQE